MTHEGQILYDCKDFNYARLITHQELVPYIAPEMLACKQLFIDRYHPKATDCWALGVILYFMIFYKLPFNDDNSKKVTISVKVSNSVRFLTVFGKFICNFFSAEKTGTNFDRCSSNELFLW